MASPQTKALAVHMVLNRHLSHERVAEILNHLEGDIAIPYEGNDGEQATLNGFSKESIGRWVR